MAINVLVHDIEAVDEEASMIIDATCARCGCTRDDLSVEPRSDNCRLAIGVAGYLLINDRKLLLDDVARLLGVPAPIVATQTQAWHEHIDVCADVRDDVNDAGEGTQPELTWPMRQGRVMDRRFRGEDVRPFIGKTLTFRLSDSFELPACDIVGPRKSKHTRAVWARMAGATLLYRVLIAKPSMPAVGRFFGVHHTTVLNSLRRVDAAVSRPDTCAHYEGIELLCRAYGKAPDVLKAPQ